MRTSEENNSNNSARLSKLQCTCPEDHLEDNYFSRNESFIFCTIFRTNFFPICAKILPILSPRLLSKRSDDYLREFILRQNFLFLLVGIRNVNFVTFYSKRSCHFVKSIFFLYRGIFWAGFSRKIVYFYSCFWTLVKDFSPFWQLFLLCYLYCLERVQRRC